MLASRTMSQINLFPLSVIPAQGFCFNNRRWTKAVWLQTAGITRLTHSQKPEVGHGGTLLRSPWHPGLVWPWDLGKVSSGLGDQFSSSEKFHNFPLGSRIVRILWSSLMGSSELLLCPARASEPEDLVCHQLLFFGSRSARGMPADSETHPVGLSL